MKLYTILPFFSLGLATRTSASPISHPRRQAATQSNSTETTTDVVLKPETLAVIQATVDALGIDGAIVAYTSPKGDGLLTFGNKSVDGDSITPDVSEIPESVDRRLICHSDSLCPRVQLEAVPRNHARLARREEHHPTRRQGSLHASHPAQGLCARLQDVRRQRHRAHQLA